MRQRLGLAQAIMEDPKLLILDEPMNGLDPRTEHWLTDFLINLNQNGKTVITSTHDLVLARRISSRALLFSPDHTLAADLPTADLLKDRSLLEKVELVDAEDETWGGAKLAGFLGEKD